LSVGLSKGDRFQEFLKRLEHTSCASSRMAYVLLRSPREFGLKGTPLETAQADTIRLRLLKIGAVIRVTVREVWIALSEAYPWRDFLVRCTTSSRRGDNPCRRATRPDPTFGRRKPIRINDSKSPRAEMMWLRVCAGHAKNAPDTCDKAEIRPPPGRIPGRRIPRLPTIPRSSPPASLPRRKAATKPPCEKCGLTSR
jgi:Transposase DDE domain group 1